MRKSLFWVDSYGNVTSSGDLTLPVYSITKMLIAFAILKLNVPLSTRIEEWIDREICSHKITVGQLLNHSSGLTDYGALPEYHAAIKSGHLWDDSDFAKHTLHQPLLFQPGTSFAYSNPGYWLLKEILIRESNQTFGTTLQKLIFTPLEMNSAYVAEDQFAEDLPWYPAAWVWHGLVMANAQDIVRFLTELDPARHVANLAKVGSAPRPWQNPHYGNGVMVEPDHWYGHNGAGPGYTASAFHFVKEGITGCLLRTLSSDESENSDPAMQDLFKHVEVDYS